MQFVSTHGIPEPTTSTQVRHMIDMVHCVVETCVSFPLAVGPALWQLLQPRTLIFAARRCHRPLLKRVLGARQSCVRLSLCRCCKIFVFYDVKPNVLRCLTVPTSSFSSGTAEEATPPSLVNSASRPPFYTKFIQILRLSLLDCANLRSTRAASTIRHLDAIRSLEPHTAVAVLVSLRRTA